MADQPDVPSLVAVLPMRGSTVHTDTAGMSAARFGKHLLLASQTLCSAQLAGALWGWMAAGGPLPALPSLQPAPCSWCIPKFLAAKGIFWDTKLWELVPGLVSRPAFPAGVVSREAVFPDSSLCSAHSAFCGLPLCFLPFLHTDACQEDPSLSFCTCKSSQFYLYLCAHTGMDRQPWVKPGKG